VARGLPLAASACAPTTRNRTRWEHNKPINSFHSHGSCIVDPEGCLADCLHGAHSIFDAGGLPVPHFSVHGFLRSGPGKDLVHATMVSRLPACGKQIRQVLRSPRAQSILAYAPESPRALDRISPKESKISAAQGSLSGEGPAIPPSRWCTCPPAKSWQRFQSP
jgi:hypothetical protein